MLTRHMSKWLITQRNRIYHSNRKKNLQLTDGPTATSSANLQKNKETRSKTELITDIRIVNRKTNDFIFIIVPFFQTERVFGVAQK